MNPLSLFSDTCGGVLVSGLISGAGGTGIIRNLVELNREVWF